MSTKYIKHQSFWNVQERNDNLGVWKNILRNRQIALKCFKRSIVDGKSTSVWFNPWLKGGRLTNRMGVEVMERVRSEKLTVQSIIDNNEWRVKRLSYLAQFEEEIRETKIHIETEEDSWYWACSKNGKHNFKNIWQSIHTSHAHAHALCMYKIVNNCLPTKIKIKQRGMLISTTCDFCKQQDEDIKHLFFK